MDNGARGCQIVISGKLTGQRHRTEKFKEGHIKFCGEPRLKFIKVGFAVAKLKPGVIGVKVEIMDPTAKLPDEVDVMTPEKAVEAMPEMADLLLPKKESAPQEPTSVGESAAGDESVENVKETVEGSGKEEGTTGEPSASAPTEEKPADEQSDVPATNSSKEV